MYHAPGLLRFLLGLVVRWAGRQGVLQYGDSRDEWRWMLALSVVLAAVFFCHPLLLDIPLLDPDEGLHASIAQEMVEGGDWLTPRLLGRPFLDKPIFYFWAQALSLQTFGMH